MDDDDYHRGVEDLKFSGIWRLTLQRSVLIPTIMELRRKLSDFLLINDVIVIPLGKGVDHILLQSLKDQCNTMPVGTVFLKPQVMRLNRWLPSFNVVIHIQTTTQVWIRIFHMPLEFRKTHNSFNIAMGVNLQIQIDPVTSSLLHEINAKVFDLLTPLVRCHVEFGSQIRIITVSITSNSLWT